MITTEKMSIAALLSVNLRRKVNRTIDVQWLLENEDYAREIIKFTRAQGQTDLIDYANTLEKLIFGKVLAATAESAKVEKTKPEVENAPFRSTLIDWAKEAEAAGESDNEKEDEVIVTSKKNYIGHLR